MTTPAAGQGACVTCGAVITPATAHLAPSGAVCWPCFELAQSEAAVAEVAAAALEQSLTKRARTLGGAHFAMWGMSAILAAQWAPLPSWLASALVAGAFGLAIGLAVRRLWAYQLAIGLDVAAVLAIVVGVPLRVRFGAGWLAVLAAGFPVALLRHARGERAAYRIETENYFRPPPARVPRWLVAALAVAALGIVGVTLARRPRRDPARELMREALPSWEILRAHRGPGGPALAALLERTRRWPQLAEPLGALDRAWPDEAQLRADAQALNHALASAGLPYFTDVWRVGQQPLLLTYDLAARVPWRIGTRTVEVVRVRRLDTLNVEFGLLGSTEHGQPVTLLDRIEAELATDLPAMYGKAARRGATTLNDFDRLVLAKRRDFYEKRFGTSVATAAAALGERDRLLEEMRGRLHHGEVELQSPEGFVLGAEWLETLRPLAQLTHPGGPLILDTDLKEVVRADEQLRDEATTRLFAAAVDLSASATEAHEARHAFDGEERAAPPPPALFAVMEGSSTSMIALADGELRAFLGEVHDAPSPACVTLARVLRNAFGAEARATPHFFAAEALVTALDATHDGEPTARLGALCAVPDGELRGRVASAWQHLYAEPMPLAVQGTPIPPTPSGAERAQ
jgi:hypothetical protein